MHVKSPWKKSHKRPFICLTQLIFCLSELICLKNFSQSDGLTRSFTLTAITNSLGLCSILFNPGIISVLGQSLNPETGEHSDALFIEFFCQSIAALCALSKKLSSQARHKCCMKTNASHDPGLLVPPWCPLVPPWTSRVS